MTQVINAQGHLVPVTVLEAGPCLVTDVKNVQKHGYKAVQLGFGAVKDKHLSKAMKTAFEKKKVQARRILREVRLEEKENFELGQEIKVDVFKPGDLVDIQGRSIGRGFAGGVKRWDWRGGPGSHGSMFHRRIGSVGASSFPSRTWPGHHMPGHMGDVNITVQNLEVVKIDLERNLMLVKGAVPGKENNLLFIRRSLKRPLGIVIKEKKAAAKTKDPLKASKQAAAGKGGKK